MKKLLIVVLKIGISAAILTWLIWEATRPREDGENVFVRLQQQSKNWGLLAAATLLCASAVMLTMIRWWYLVRALELPLSFRGALRIGFLGYLFNLAPMGIVGGDLLKAVMLSREYKAARMKAFATVAVDRLIGLYMVFVVAAAAILLTGFWRLEIPEIAFVRNFTFIVTAVGGVLLAALLAPGFTDGRGTRALSRLPKVGHGIESLIEAMRMYRRKPLVLVNAAIMSVGVHCLFALGVYFIARGLPGDVLALGTHFVINPLSAATGAIPLPLGPFELVLEFLYTHVPEPGVEIAKGQGLVVALTYRLICVLIAMIGLVYYLAGRREVAAMMHDAEQQQ